MNQLTFYVTEKQLHAGMPLYEWLLEEARELGILGGTAGCARRPSSSLPGSWRCRWNSSWTTSSPSRCCSGCACRASASSTYAARSNQELFNVRLAMGLSVF